MTRLVLLDCRESLRGFQHVAMDGRNKVLSVFLPGLIADAGALNEFRTKPYQFAAKFNLEYAEYFRSNLK